jgi:outer membrane protein assembly factor BamB
MPAVGWSQVHADSASQGSRFVNTLESLTPLWSVAVGHVVYSSPVIGPDGTIYVGNLEGQLIAVNPDGTIKFQFESGVPILGAPAVADNGNIYFLNTQPFPDATFPDNKLRSAIGLLSPTGGQPQLRKIPDQGFTTGSPKLFTINGAPFVALHVRTRFDGSPPANQSAVLVYDEQLINPPARHDIGCGSLVVVGVGPDIFGPIADFLKKVLEFDPSHGTSVDIPPLFAVFGELQPSVAVAHRPDLGPPEEPFIVVVNRMCATVGAFRWRQPNIIRVWENHLTQDDEPAALSSPAVLNDAGVVVVGRLDGRVVAFDLATGDQRWLSDDLGGPVLATPASVDKLVYVADSGTIHALNAVTGARVHERELTGIRDGSPAVSANHVHLQTHAEISTFSLDFSSTDHDDDGFGGTSSPAIGSDGTVYVIVQPGDPRQLERDVPAKLVAYPPRPTSPDGGLPIPPPDGPIRDAT